MDEVSSYVCSYVVVESIFKNERNSLLGILGGFPINN